MRAVLPPLSLALIALVAYSPANVDAPAVPAAADTTWTWPENPENLQVLPQDIGAFRLGEIMRRFTSALGVRCQHCHVGEEGMSLAEFDFVSDDNGHKEVAREMMRMTWAINNDMLAGIDGLHEADGMRVTCYTCHRGQTTPETSAANPPWEPPSEDEEQKQEAQEDGDGDEHDHHDHGEGGGHDHDGGG